MHVPGAPRLREGQSDSDGQGLMSLGSCVLEFLVNSRSSFPELAPTLFELLCFIEQTIMARTARSARGYVSLLPLEIVSPRGCAFLVSGLVSRFLGPECMLGYPDLFGLLLIHAAATRQTAWFAFLAATPVRVKSELQADLALCPSRCPKGTDKFQIKPDQQHRRRHQRAMREESDLVGMDLWSWPPPCSPSLPFGALP